MLLLIEARSANFELAQKNIAPTQHLFLCETLCRCAMGMQPKASGTLSEKCCNQSEYLNTSLQRAVLEIEPRTSRTQRENHTTRPNSLLAHDLIV